MRAILLGVLLCSASVARADPGEEIARGEMLVTIGDCGGCHTADPNQPFAGGKRIETPFGAITAPNLTSDRDTGIGAWSDDDFRRALREGVAPNGTRYYPVFPYPHFTKLTRNDILAIKSYLASLPAVSNKVAAPELRFPYSFRPLLRLWNYAFLKPGLFEPDQSKTTEWNRGGYLVEGIAHCGNCHTPKNLFGAEKRQRAYGGSRIAGWFAPRLDNAPRGGLARWSTDDIVDYLTTGRNAKSHAAGPMADVIARSTSKMDPADLRAIAIYLKALPTGREPNVSPASDATMIAGETVYARACIGCHQADGSGAAGLTPPLPGNALLQSDDPLSTLRVLLDGAQAANLPPAPNAKPMPAYARELTDQQIADVASYIRNAWGNAAPAVSADEVRRARH
ncbi:c-type cytochrome [Bradyrhizobium sp. HKCCYLS1011]|uniref:c-type cytochrome n=1 Tax=Bradyrhizobium sp. HKCCYLS1011 TaxID=3420733 RepID=UPI003EBF9223